MFGGIIVPANQHQHEIKANVHDRTLYRAEAREYRPGLIQRSLTLSGVSNLSTGSTEQADLKERVVLALDSGETGLLMIATGSTIGAPVDMYGAFTPYTHNMITPTIAGWEALLFAESTQQLTGICLTDRTVLASTGVYATHISTGATDGGGTVVVHVTDSTTTGSTSFDWVVQHSSDGTEWVNISSGTHALSTAAKQSAVQTSFEALSIKPRTRFRVTSLPASTTTRLAVGFARETSPTATIELPASDWHNRVSADIDDDLTETGFFTYTTFFASDGAIEVVDNDYAVTSGSSRMLATIDTDDAAAGGTGDIAISARIYFETSPSKRGGFSLRATDADDHLFARYDFDSGGTVGVRKLVGGSPTVLASNRSASFTTGTVYWVRATIEGSTIKVWAPQPDGAEPDWSAITPLVSHTLSAGDALLFPSSIHVHGTRSANSGVRYYETHWSLP